MEPSIKSFIIKFAVLILLSPLIGFAALLIVENINKAKRLTGIRKAIALGFAGFLIAVLLGWLK